MSTPRLPLLLLGLVACVSPASSPSAKPVAQPVPAPPRAAAAPETPITEPDGLVVLSRGAEPRRALRLSAKVGDAFDNEVVLGGQVSMPHPGGQVIAHIPEAYWVGRETVTAVGADQIALKRRGRAERVPEHPGMQEKFDLLKWDIHVDKRAAPLPWEAAGSIRNKVAAMVNTPLLISAFENVELPLAPVGVGAHWRARAHMTVMNIRFEYQVDCRLTELADDRFTLEVDTTADDLPAEIHFVSNYSWLVTSVHVVSKIQRGFHIGDPATASMTLDSVQTALVGGGGQPVARVGIEIQLHLRASSPPADQLDALKASADSLDRGVRCTKQVARLRAMMKHWERTSPAAEDIQDAPVPRDFDTPTGVDPMLRFSPAALGILLDDKGAVVLLRGNPALHWSHRKIDAAFVHRLTREIDTSRKQLGRAPMVAIVATAGASAQPIARIRRALAADVPFGIAVRKTKQAVVDQVMDYLPKTPAWARAVVAEHGDKVMAQQIMGLPTMAPALLSAGLLCPKISPALGQAVHGATVDVVFPAIVDAAEDCRCEGVDLDAYLGLMAPMMLPASAHGFLPLPADVPTTGTVGDVVKRIAQTTVRTH